MDSLEKLKEKKLPGQDKFYSSLQCRGVSDSDYQRALETFKAFECQNIGDYTLLYCISDTVLLAEVMFAFFDEVKKEFGLCASNYISLPQLSFDIMLLVSKIELDNLPNLDMVLMYENSIRGGTVFVNQRETNVKKDGGFVEYLDFNNLYGKMQCHYLPVSNYFWLSEEEIKRFTKDKILGLDPEGDYGYTFEVTLEYPNEIREIHRHFPLAPENISIFWNDLSPAAQESLRVTKSKKACENYKSQKLCNTFLKKEYYVTDFRNLQFYLKHGMKLVKIHRIIEYRQAPFSKSFIAMTAKKRAEAKSEFRKRFFKLIANSTYGRYLMQKRNHVDVKFSNKESIIAKYYGSPRFDNVRHLNEDLTAIFLKKESVVLDRQYSIGFTILELAKLEMFKFLYDVLIPRFGVDSFEIIMSDTDSYIIHFKSPLTREKVWEKLKDWMDFSNLPRSDPFYDVKNAKVPGFMKTEIPRAEITHCIALRSKCYAFKSVDRETGESKVEKKCKGVVKSKMAQVKFEEYEKCLHDRRVIRTKITKIESRKHQIRTIERNQMILGEFDDKRYMLNCHNHSMPYQKETQMDDCQICKK